MSSKKQKKFNISKKIKTLRHSKNATIAELHKKTGIIVNTLNMYETAYKTPSLKSLIKIASFFGVSLDFLLIWDKTLYPRNINILNLADKIDKMDELNRFQIVTTANTLMGKAELNGRPIKQDDCSLDLTTSFNENIKTVRKKRGKSQTQLANETSLLQGRISNYEKNQVPPAERLINLSEHLNISIHALATGEKLCYSFDNKDLLNTILRADRLLSLEDKKIIIELMERIIQNENK